MYELLVVAQAAGQTLAGTRAQSPCNRRQQQHTQKLLVLADTTAASSTASLLGPGVASMGSSPRVSWHARAVALRYSMDGTHVRDI
jgi:hypothetical protein